MDVHIVNDFTFLFDGEEYQGRSIVDSVYSICVWRVYHIKYVYVCVYVCILIPSPPPFIPQHMPKKTEVPAINWWREEVYQTAAPPAAHKNYSACPRCSRMLNPCVFLYGCILYVYIAARRAANGRHNLYSPITYTNKHKNIASPAQPNLPPSPCAISPTSGLRRCG